jgi:hypothetical protein
MTDDMKRRPSLVAKTHRRCVSRRLVAGKWIDASAGSTSIFSELVRAISAKAAAKNDKPKRNQK